MLTLQMGDKQAQWEIPGPKQKGISWANCRLFTSIFDDSSHQIANAFNFVDIAHFFFLGLLHTLLAAGLPR